MPKCPLKKFEIEIFYYGDLAFIWGFLGDFTINDAEEVSWWLLLLRGHLFGFLLGQMPPLMEAVVVLEEVGVLILK